MRTLFIVSAVLLAIPALAAEVVGSQWNDSNTIQLPGGPDPYPGDTSPPGDSGGGEGSNGGGSSGFASGGGTLFGGDETVNSGSGQGSNGSGSGSGSSDFIIFGAPSAGSGSNQEGSDDDTVSLLGALIGSGAVSGSTASGAPGSHNLDSSSGVFISGAKVRAALQGKGVLKVTLRAFGIKNGSFSNSDLSLIGASAMLKNPALESAFISLSRFDITYRSQGYLFAVVPIAFPVRVSVNPAESTLAARVTVRFPWYSFFLRKFVTKDSLARDIDALITKDSDPSIDRSQLQAKIFSDVSAMLQGRIDTVEGSVST